MVGAHAVPIATATDARSGGPPSRVGRTRRAWAARAFAATPVRTSVRPTRAARTAGSRCVATSIWTRARSRAPARRAPRWIRASRGAVRLPAASRCHASARPHRHRRASRRTGCASSMPSGRVRTACVRTHRATCLARSARPVTRVRVFGATRRPTGASRRLVPAVQAPAPTRSQTAVVATTGTPAPSTTGARAASAPEPHARARHHHRRPACRRPFFDRTPRRVGAVRAASASIPTSTRRVRTVVNEGRAAPSHVCRHRVIRWNNADALRERRVIYPMKQASCAAPQEHSVSGSHVPDPSTARRGFDAPATSGARDSVTTTTTVRGSRSVPMEPRNRGPAVDPVLPGPTVDATLGLSASSPRTNFVAGPTTPSASPPVRDDTSTLARSTRTPRAPSERSVYTSAVVSTDVCRSVLRRLPRVRAAPPVRAASRRFVSMASTMGFVFDATRLVVR
jgi:hypothetical protein